MTTPLPKNKERKLLNKLRSPIHISFIAESILECNDYNAKEILKDYIEEGVIEEVKDNKNFYRTKSNA
jgi:ferritin